MSSVTTYSFPYSRIIRSSAPPLLRFKNAPLLTVGICNKNQMVKVLSYIDTGSQWCLYSNEFASALGIKDYRNTAEHFPIGGIGGSNENHAYFHDLDLLFFKDQRNPKRKNAIEIKTKIGFLEKQFSFGGILGVYGFLDRFCFVGNIPKNYFELIEVI